MTQTPPLLRIAHTPAVCVAPSATVQDAIGAMAENRVGGVAVTDGDRLVGILTERDILTKIAVARVDPAETRVDSIMVRDPVTVGPNERRSKALDTMLEKHFRHLPIVDTDGTLLAMLSIRHLLRHQVERLKTEVDSLEAYITADGPGG